MSASSFPLPTVMAGISVTLTTGFAGGAVQLPILAVRPASTCSIPEGSCGQYAAITIQIPFELSIPGPTLTRLVVAENGVPGGAFDVKIVPDQVHIPNGCEVQANTTFGCSLRPIVTHANGTLVNVGNPAKSGEELVMYAFGLGATTPAVATGEATSSPAPLKQQVRLNFDYRPNASPSNLVTYPEICQTKPVCYQVLPVFAGLTPGFAGLYQVNFIVPPPPPGTPKCNADPPDLL